MEGTRTPILCIAILVASVAILPTPRQAAARTIKIPLIRGTTQGAGTLGQPVISYYSPVNIGTPAKVFNVQFDVGFNDLFVPHYTWSPFKINLHYGKGYQCKVSSTCVKSPNELSVEYQHCKLTGKRYEDLLTLQTAYGSAASLNNQSSASVGPSAYPTSMRQSFLAIADASDARFKQLPVDGFFGLGPLSQSGSGTVNILANLQVNRLIDNLQFSMWLNPLLDSKQGGELVLGGVDESRYQGQIYWHHLSAVHSQWVLNLQYISLGNQIVGCNGQQCQAVLSSAVNEVYGPRVDVQRIYSILNTSHQSSGLELIDCRRILNLPILTFSVDGIPYSMLPSNYVRKTTDGVIFKSETCYVAILPTDSSNSKQWTLGTNFLGAYYSIYDMTYRQVGFASLR